MQQGNRIKWVREVSWYRPNSRCSNAWSMWCWCYCTPGPIPHTLASFLHEMRSFENWDSLKDNGRWVLVGEILNIEPSKKVESRKLILTSHLYSIANKIKILLLILSDQTIGKKKIVATTVTVCWSDNIWTIRTSINIPLQHNGKIFRDILLEEEP